jgi:Tol biopolymer transport system component
LARSRASDSALLGPISFASRQDESGWPLDAGQQFATSVKAVHAAFGFDGMRNGMPWERVWYFGDQELLRTGGNWDAGSRGRLTVQVKAGEGGFVAGNYRLEIYAEGELLGQASFVMFADEAPAPRPIEVAYTTLDSDTHQINRLDLDSGEAEPLLVSARYPAWSADATGLLFYGERGIEAGTPGLWVLNISQGKSYQLNEETAFRSIAWSPQRTFMATSVITDQAPHLTLLDLARNKVFSGPLGEDPVWSPEGHRLAYRGCGSGSWNISTIQVISNVFDIDTIQTLTEADDSQPAWSQDGQRIAFVRDEAGNQDIYVISADARELTRLTDHPAVDTSPAWTPDNRLLFRSLRSGQWGIYVMDADGENQRLLLDTPSELTWQPDGLAVTSDVTWLEAAPPPVPKPRVQVPAGRGLLVVSNRQNNDEMTFTIDNTEHKVAPYQVRTLPLKPGQYTWTASWPAKVSRTGLADIALGQVAYPVVCKLVWTGFHGRFVRSARPITPL